MKHKFYHIFTLFTLCIGLSACWGIQDSYDYKPANVDPHLYMNVWEFIETRDTLSLMQEAIEHVENDFPGFKELYTQKEGKYTYMLLNNNAFQGKSSSIFTTFGVKNETEIDTKKLRDVLLYHIVQGNYHSLSVEGSLNFNPINVVTLLESQDAIMTLRINDNISRTNYSRLLANDNLGASPTRTAATSNLLATNGVVHIFSNPIIYIPQ